MITPKRFLQGLLREGAAYRVPFGPVAGLRLQYRKQINLREMLGLWERHNFSAIDLLCAAGLIATGETNVMFDVGANFGLYTLFFGRLLSGTGRVIAFEPADLPRRMLEGNVRLNGLTNVTIEPLACSDRIGEVTLYLGANHHNSSLESDRVEAGVTSPATAQVAATTLDHYWSTKKRGAERAALIKVDIEGAAAAALPCCGSIATNDRPFFLIESHSPSEDGAVGEFAGNYEYVLYRTTNKRWVTEPRATYPDVDGIWGTLLLVPTEKALETRRALGNR